MALSTVGNADSGSKRHMYISGHPSLHGRTLFANTLKVCSFPSIEV
ncbi:hypothetical protein [Dyadobacter crusticola]|nr:hypothetical protein [Dyadobacter crusticola]